MMGNTQLKTHQRDGGCSVGRSAASPALKFSSALSSLRRRGLFLYFLIENVSVESVTGFIREMRVQMRRGDPSAALVTAHRGTQTFK